MSNSGRLSGSRASTEPASRLGPPGFDPERLATALSDEMLYDLRNVAEGKPTVPGFGSPVWHLKCLGYVEERTIMKPCRTCGTPQRDYSYDKITPAGREVLNAASGTETRQRQDREDGPDPKGDGPTVEDGDAQTPSENGNHG